MTGLKGVAAAVALVVSGGAFAQSVPVPKFIADRGGKVVEAKPGPNGTTVYTVEKDGKKLVFFLNSDKKTAIVGVLFDAQTGENLSDAYMPDQVADQVNQSQAVAQSQPATESFAKGHKAFSGDTMQEHLRQVAKIGSDGEGLSKYMASEKVAGVLESGKGGTTFVFFDPQCPHCHTLFERTRAIAGKGRAIKWIPVNTLGNGGVPLSTAFLYGGAQAVPNLIAKNLKPRDPSNSERSMIDQNTALLVMATRAVGLSAATPTIIFKNPASGRLAVVQGDGSDKEGFNAAFGLK